MSDTAFQPGGSHNTAPAFAPGTFAGPPVVPGTSVDPGTVIYARTDGTSAFARANAANTSNAIGFAITAAENPNRPMLQDSGLLTLPTGIWDDLSGGTGGLTPNAIYYLSAVSPGGISTTPPSSPNYIVPVGVAISPTTMHINIGTAVVAPA